MHHTEIVYLIRLSSLTLTDTRSVATIIFWVTLPGHIPGVLRQRHTDVNLSAGSGTAVTSHWRCSQVL
ncbi:hypothetical protein RRG08_023523 [Elysia crispata]|uniref:Uncharacterized protein n=1 Tax=Elysia crispata TaxID=231223 RepID=A0AAE1D7A9_9GAST|nr:hypothetical protein RRG08_023523 [Elysia crispata]